MIEVAETLADRFRFGRVDMYSIRGQIIFGEMTCYPADGR
ncbi:ATP-grasp fold amidoligase family protein, partial [Ornithobacterium rhinotracheale]